MSSDKIKNKIDNKWDDKTCLNNLSLFLKDRVKVGVKFLTDEDDLIHGYNIVFVAGDSILPSGLVEFEWPWQPMPMPEAFEGKLH